MRSAELAPPMHGEVAIGVRTAGMNPVDDKHYRPGDDPSVLSLPIGNEVAGGITAIGPDTRLASGGERLATRSSHSVSRATEPSAASRKRRVFDLLSSR
jgi:NADPH:quinone reductase-like Zn-dependent oxidoreductase